MASGSKLVLPMVVLNMGGEMVNILHQRLNAQKVETDKKGAVLRDVICTMYAPKVPSPCSARRWMKRALVCRWVPYTVTLTTSGNRPV